MVDLEIDADRSNEIDPALTVSTQNMLYKELMFLYCISSFIDKY